MVGGREANLTRVGCVHICLGGKEVGGEGGREGGTDGGWRREGGKAAIKQHTCISNTETSSEIRMHGQ